MITAIGYTFIFLSIGHTLTGIVIFRKTWIETMREGFINRFLAKIERRAAFWFMMFSPFLFLLGQLTLYAHTSGDLLLQKSVGIYAVIIGLMGVMALPKSPFWVALLAGPILILA